MNFSTLLMLRRVSQEGWNKLCLEIASLSFLKAPSGRKVREEKRRHYRLIKVDAICKDLIAVEFRMHCVFASSERAAAASCGLCVRRRTAIT